MNRKKVYLLPGLGFDQRIFGKLQLEATTSFMEWHPPLEGETIAGYAQRTREKYQLPSDAILIGHSFGGIMAQEIARMYPVEKVILISSIRSPEENPSKFTTLAKLGLHRMFTKEITLMTFPYWAKIGGYVTGEEQELFMEMVSDQDNRYLQWALYQLSTWRGVGPLDCPVLQIHGDQDMTFPLAKLRRPDYVLPGGTHVMVYSQAKEVGKWINEMI